MINPFIMQSEPRPSDNGQAAFGMCAAEVKPVTQNAVPTYAPHSWRQALASVSGSAAAERESSESKAKDSTHGDKQRNATCLTCQVLLRSRTNRIDNLK